MSAARSLLLGHRGLSAKHLENSMEAFRAALTAGMDGFELDVQPTRDGVCLVLHDEDLGRTANGSGLLRQMKAAELPALKNGEPLPRLADVLDLPAKLINVELKGEPGWQQALATVEAAEALDRVLFSSFEHSEVLQLWAACETARCGFLWETDEAMDLSAEELADLPEALWLHPPLKAVKARPELWAPYAQRLALWGMATPAEAAGLPFTPAVLIADSI
ncbi:glycerophosphodiester phosphodiesterase family protein [Geothrix sp. PMB-07]|uniref:glycerophosphodiester phosphodiesterase n=1 Tax=Geothrix sp. PMB-07 TaxID=3068640 RepID=UPI002741DAB1|nr:glycerophosphodiester phosphodiesterase family protein [Geothrix sp. PMB-07]WLT32044.1 glycerophosphodiester phosphodiesterase family protein [Geothrix sp. PMB-07]